MSLVSLGLSVDQAHKLLVSPEIASAITYQDPLAGLVDASDRLEGGGVITWWNNIEVDSRYFGYCFV